ncbi:glycosyltransferase involved in cell wall biosynthesis [Rhodoblastus acidophilus]|uniref:glycosyltransferase n=1 Tax=Rhodoblastus acidophilus TaxID=1074 RepID=UPI0022258218|nr:glycosyltransferase [Rhodoblastus acidophilus]MCW2284370.1 glycosyltransferase involved in cell wall biosynthesis [Rhodoblastus acidophilus]MCW2333152.1 glycosyltransferase involved in cell wall biosynthesis [Rhodoblastus acidophilus]
MTKSFPRLPPWFEPGVRLAGSLDDVNLPDGFVGWALDMSELAHHFEISVICAGQTIARGRTGLARPDLGRLIGVDVACGFQIGWADFDREAVRALVESGEGRAEIDVRVDAQEAALSGPRDLPTLTAADCWTFLGGAPAFSDAWSEEAPSDDEIVIRAEAMGLFDMGCYMQHAGVAGSQAIDGTLVAHYFAEGEREGARPNPYFDPKWYAGKYMSGARRGALRHYIEIGEAKGNKPCPVFDPQWYRETYLSDAAHVSPLAHYLANRHANQHNPNAYFDIEFYLAAYPDVAEARMDGFSHWLKHGIFEGRSGSPNFSAEHVWERYLGGQKERNAFEVFMDVGLDFGWTAVSPSDLSAHRAKSGNPRRSIRPTESRGVVLIGHDACPSTPQRFLLALGELFKKRFGMEMRFVLLEGGALAQDYRELAETYVVSETRGDAWSDLRAHLGELVRSGFTHAISNTAMSGGVTAILEELKFDFCSIVHELPKQIRSRDLAGAFAALRQRGRAVVYPNAFVKTALDGAFGADDARAIVIPQGLHDAPIVPEGARTHLRRELGLQPDAEIVLNVDVGDLNKGVDLFPLLAERLRTLRPGAHLVWLGDVPPVLAPWLKHDINERGLTNLTILPYDREVGRYFGAADVFVSMSREDPFPSVMLQALQTGLPVVAFADSGGHAETIGDDARLGALAPPQDVETAASRIVEFLERRASGDREDAAYRSRVVKERYDLARYGAKLLSLIDPDYRTVSVIVPNYNYAEHLRDRLTSVFSQTFPVLELLLLDDASKDDSLHVAREIAAQAGRDMEIRVRAENSGSPFRQWKAGLDEIQSEFVWIAEADDMSEPRFLDESVRRLAEAPNAAFCFTDSKAINAKGALLFDSYKSYYSEFGDRGLEKSGSFSGADFLRRFLAVRNVVVNVSSVVWRTQALREIFARLGEEPFSLRCAGDWRIYVEACRSGKDILYIADTLNIHRRHERSVTQSLDRREHIKEIEAVQTVALEGESAKSELRTHAAAWRARTAREWRLDTANAPAPV